MTSYIPKKDLARKTAICSRNTERDGPYNPPPMPAVMPSSFIFWIYLKKIFASGTSVK